MQNKTKKRKIIYVFLATMILFVVQSFASKFGELITDLFNYTMIDKDGIFMRVSVHHIVQMIIALLIIFIIKKTKKLNFHLKPKVDKIGILYTSIFTIVILIYVFISYIIGYKLNTIVPYEYEINMTNILGSLGFQLLLSGTSEEILFRALPITVFGAFGCREEKNDYRLAIIIASMLFSIAHIKWTILPFAVSFSWFQLIYAFVLGLTYGVTYIKSKSIIYPMFMHGLSNFLMVGVGYMFAVMMV